MSFKKILSALLAATFMSMLLAACAFAAPGAAGKFESTIQQWVRSRRFADPDDQYITLDVTATYMSAEYIDAYVNMQAEKNLWTDQEKENYKYRFLQSLRLDKNIPILVKIENYGPSMHMAPFDNLVKLRVGTKTYEAVDYDKRFNFKLQGTIEGLVYFPRFNEKTGKPILPDKRTTVAITFNSFMSPIIQSNYELVWTIDGKDDTDRLFQGKTAARLENDRLLVRLQKLKKDKAEIDQKQKSVDSEIDYIQKRLDELAGQM